MASIPLSSDAVKAVKADLTKWFDECKSGHLSEALAYALGFKTNAAMRDEIVAQGTDPMFFFVDEERFLKRLNDFGYPIERPFYFGPEEDSVIRETVCRYAYQIEYKTKRQKAWRNLMVHTVNEALRRRLFSLRPFDNRWPGQEDRNASHMFDFTLPTGDIGRVELNDIGHCEVSVDVVINPRTELAHPAYHATLNDCDAVGMTWVERKEGAWIQSSMDSFRCNNKFLQKLLDLDVEPLGYGDRGIVK